MVELKPGKIKSTLFRLGINKAESPDHTVPSHMTFEHVIVTMIEQDANQRMALARKKRKRKQLIYSILGNVY